MKTLVSTFAALALPVVLLVGCEGEPEKPMAAASASASAPPPAPAPTAQVKKFNIEKESAKVEFAMDAPKEKIRGLAKGSSEGTLQIDLMDIAKTTGTIAVDISGLEVSQSAANDKGEFGESKVDELQNKHARAWLEISDDTPEDVRKQNSRVEFTITKIDKVAPSADVTKMTGDLRKVTFTATGDFLLHGKKTTKTVDMEGEFTWSLGKPIKVSLKTAKPFSVDLAEHDVRPRDGFGKLAKKTLEILAPSVAKEALVSLDLTGVVAFNFPSTSPSGTPSAGPAAPASGAPSAAPAASAK